MAARLQFYEIVEVVSKKPEMTEVAGLIGAVLGMAEGDNGSWIYSVYLFDKGECWCFEETDLKSTGQFKKREDFYEGESIRVGVDPKTGKGYFSD